MKMPDKQGVLLDRRRLLQAGAGLVSIAVTPGLARASVDEMQAAQESLFGNRSVQEGRVTLELPPIAENGYSVPLSISVDSPMTPEDHVRQIVVLSPRNPLPLIAQYHLGPRAGRAEVSTRVRLGGTQTLQAIAEMSDGSLYSGSAETLVTLAACVVL